MRLNNLEGLKIEHGQSSEVWEKLNKSLTFTRYLQESSNLQLSLLQSSPRELGWHPSCLLRLPTQFSLTARVQRTAQRGCLSVMPASATTEQKAQALPGCLQQRCFLFIHEDTYLQRHFLLMQGQCYPQWHFLWASSAGKKDNKAHLTFPHLETSYYTKRNTRFFIIPDRSFQCLHHLLLRGNVYPGFGLAPKSHFQHKSHACCEFPHFSNPPVFNSN